MSRSRSCDQAVQHRFNNSSDFVVDCVWVDYDGNEATYAKLGPGATHLQGAYWGGCLLEGWGRLVQACRLGFVQGKEPWSRAWVGWRTEGHRPGAAAGCSAWGEWGPRRRSLAPAPGARVPGMQPAEPATALFPRRHVCGAPLAAAARRGRRPAARVRGRLCHADGAPGRLGEGGGRGPRAGAPRDPVRALGGVPAPGALLPRAGHPRV